MRISTLLVLATLLSLTLTAQAQDKKDGADATVYKLEFNIHDGADAAAKAGRRYALLIDANGKGTLRSGNKVPYGTGSFQPGKDGTSPLASTQYNYAEVGVNIDARLREANGRVALSASLEVSAVLQPENSTTVTRQTQPSPKSASK